MQKQSSRVWLLAVGVLGWNLTGCGAPSPDEEASVDDALEFATVRQALTACTGLTVTATPATSVPVGEAIIVTAVASGCTQPRYRFESRSQDAAGNWGPWTVLQKGKHDSIGLVGGSGMVVQVRVKAKEKGASSWEVKKKKVLEWTDETCATAWDYDLHSAVLSPIAGNDTTGRGDDVTPSCGASAAPDLVYDWTAPYDGCFEFSTAGSEYDTVLAVLDCVGGTELGCNDDYYGLQSSVRLDMVATQQVSIVVDGAGSAQGAFDLSIAPCADDPEVPACEDTFSCGDSFPAGCDQCDFGVCGATAEGGALCVSALAQCGPSCTTSADCADGATCFVDSCCNGGAGSCVVPQCPGPAAMSAADGVATFAGE